MQYSIQKKCILHLALVQKQDCSSDTILEFCLLLSYDNLTLKRTFWNAILWNLYVFSIPLSKPPTQHLTYQIFRKKAIANLLKIRSCVQFSKVLALLVLKFMSFYNHRHFGRNQRSHLVFALTKRRLTIYTHFKKQTENLFRVFHVYSFKTSIGKESS